LRSPNAKNKFAFALGDRKLPAGSLYLFFLPHVSSLRSPNAKNKFAFALGDRKLPTGCLYLFFLPHVSRCHQRWWRSMHMPYKNMPCGINYKQ
jgi:hypothetical protein